MTGKRRYSVANSLFLKKYLISQWECTFLKKIQKKVHHEFSVKNILMKPNCVEKINK